MVRVICCKLGDVFGWKCISFLDPWNTVRCWNQLRLLGDVYHFFVWEKQFQELAVRILLHLDIWIQCSHRGIWLSGGRWEVSLKLREICPSLHTLANLAYQPQLPPGFRLHSLYIVFCLLSPGVDETYSDQCNILGFDL